MTVDDLNGEYCPHCGQAMPQGFATGTRSLCPDTSVRNADDVPDPDGPEGYEIITRLASGESVESIVDSTTLTRRQIEGLVPHIHQARNIKIGVMP
jgi:hypothetical protein